MSAVPGAGKGAERLLLFLASMALDSGTPYRNDAVG